MTNSNVNPHYDVDKAADNYRAAETTVLIVREAIKELGEIPSGVLYAQLCGYFSLETYQEIISLLAMAGVITIHNHMIKYVGGM